MSDTNSSPKISPVRILRRPAVEEIVGLSRSTIYAMISEGNFPKPIHLGKRAVGWLESSIVDWLNDRLNDEVSL